MQFRYCFLYIFINWTQEAMSAFSEIGKLTALSTLDNPTVLTIRMNSDNAKNDFNAFISNTSTLISKLLVAQKKGKPKLLIFLQTYLISSKLIFQYNYPSPCTDFCDCCDSSAIEVLQSRTPPLSSLPTPAILVSLDVCTGLPEAPRACTCSNRRLEVRPYTYSLSHTDTIYMYK